MHEIVQYAPLVLVVVVFIWQNRLFVTPEQLEKKHREILNDVEGKYIALNTYNEFKQKVVSDLDEVKSGINEIKEFLMKRRRGD